MIPTQYLFYNNPDDITEIAKDFYESNPGSLGKTTLIFLPNKKVYRRWVPKPKQINLFCGHSATDNVS